MRRLLIVPLIIVHFWSTHFSCRGDDDSVTLNASQLARHLGIHSLKISSSALPPIFAAHLYRVKGGKIVGPQTEYFPFVLKNTGDLLISYNSIDKGIDISIDNGTTVASAIIPPLGAAGSIVYNETVQTNADLTPTIILGKLTADKAHATPALGYTNHSYHDFDAGYVIVITPKDSSFKFDK